MDSFHRLSRCVSPCPDASGRTEVSAICGQQASLPIHLSTFRIGGLATSPRELTKLLRPVVALFRQRGVKLHVYLDDWLIHADTPQQALLHAQTTIGVLQFLGWIINFEKSDLTPSQDFQFIGCSSTLDNSQWRPCRRCVSKVQSVYQHWMTNPNIKAHDLHRLLGILVFMASLVQREDFVFVRSSGGPPQHGARGPGTGPTVSQFLRGCWQRLPGGHHQQSCKVYPLPPMRWK